MQSPEDSRPTAATPASPVTRIARKGAPPPQDDTLGALDVQRSAPDKKGRDKEKPAKARAKERTEPLNFRVTGDFRRAFKRAAAAQDCKKVELLERIFAEWSARNPA